MVSASPADVDVAPRPTLEDCIELVRLMVVYPANPFAPAAQRVSWLLKAATQLEKLGYVAEANTAREKAMTIVRAVVSKVAGTDRR